MYAMFGVRIPITTKIKINFNFKSNLIKFILITFNKLTLDYF